MSEKSVFWASLWAPSISSRMVRLWGDQIAQASTPPDSMAVTTEEASISMAVISSMVRPTLFRALVRMTSLEVPEE